MRPTFLRPLLLAVFACLLVNCSLTRSNDRHDDDDDDDTVVVAEATSPDIVRSPQPGLLEFWRLYLPTIGGGGRRPDCAEVRGDLNDLGWNSGPTIYDDNGDDFLEFWIPEQARGSYELTLYASPGCGAGSLTEVERWSAYGDVDILDTLTSDQLAWVYCTWWDDIEEDIVDPPAGQADGCDINIYVERDGTITPDGNMWNW